MIQTLPATTGPQNQASGGRLLAISSTAGFSDLLAMLTAAKNVAVGQMNSPPLQLQKRESPGTPESGLDNLYSSAPNGGPLRVPTTSPAERDLPGAVKAEESASAGKRPSALRAASDMPRNAREKSSLTRRPVKSLAGEGSAAAVVDESKAGAATSSTAMYASLKLSAAIEPESAAARLATSGPGSAGEDKSGPSTASAEQYRSAGSVGASAGKGSSVLTKCASDTNAIPPETPEGAPYPDAGLRNQDGALAVRSENGAENATPASSYDSADLASSGANAGRAAMPDAQASGSQATACSNTAIQLDGLFSDPTASCAGFETAAAPHTSPVSAEAGQRRNATNSASKEPEQTDDGSASVVSAPKLAQSFDWTPSPDSERSRSGAGNMPESGRSDAAAGRQTPELKTLHESSASKRVSLDSRPLSPQRSSDTAMPAPPLAGEANATASEPSSAASNLGVMVQFAKPGEGNQPDSISAQPDAGSKLEVPAQNLSPAPASLTTLPTGRVLQSLGQAELRVGLNTASFGNVEVRTMVAGNHVAASVVASHSELRAAMMAEMPSLQHAMEQRQLRLERFDLGSHTGSQGQGTTAEEQRKPPTPPLAGETRSLEIAGPVEETWLTTPAVSPAGLNVHA